MVGVMVEDGAGIGRNVFVGVIRYMGGVLEA